MVENRTKAAKERALRKYEVYREERNSCKTTKNENSKLFDTSIITLAGGAFGLSLAFLKQFAPTINSDTVWLIRWAWAGFGLSLLSTLVSFQTSQYGMDRQIKVLEHEYYPEKSESKTKPAPQGKKLKQEQANENERQAKKLRNAWNVTTHILNWVSISAFIVGVFFLGYFSSENLNLKEEVKAVAGQKGSGSSKGTPLPRSKGVEKRGSTQPSAGGANKPANRGSTSTSPPIQPPRTRDGKK